MSAAFVVSKLLPSAGVAVAATQAVEQIIQAPDPMLGAFGIEMISKPLFFLALFGASLSVLVLRGATMEGLDLPVGDTRSGRWLSVPLKIGYFALAVILYAGVTAGILSAILDYTTPGSTIHSSPGWVGTSFVLGVLIRFVMPAIKSGLDRAIDVTVGAYEGVLKRIGGGS